MHIDREMADLRAAARLFQVRLDWPKEPEETSGSRWRNIVYSDILRHTRAITPPTLPSEAQAQTDAPRKRPPIKNIVLDRLREAGKEGSKSAPIRRYIERVYDDKVHEKTVGMTLYRLSKQGLVRREGQTWFFVPPEEAETENPGAATPGSENV